MALLLCAVLGSYPLLPEEDANRPHKKKALWSLPTKNNPVPPPLPTVAVRKCSSHKLLEFANEDKRVREDVLIDILHRFAPPLGEQPDLLFLPTSCGWGDPTMQPVQAAGAGHAHRAGPARLHRPNRPHKDAQRPPQPYRG